MTQVCRACTLHVQLTFSALNSAIPEALIEILEDTDGCAVQYHCEASLYMLHKAAIETNVIFDRAIDASGHGKKEIDGLNGTNDHYTRRELRGNSEYKT